MKALILAPVLLCACASPAPEFLGAPQTRIERDGMRFALFRKGDRVQVIRLDHADRATRQSLPDLMLRLIAEETGCQPRLSSLRGDTGEIRARLACPADQSAPRAASG
ncbi:hypothetical protein ACFQXB_07215 [Plastorhodobacter daqingensis]|uniref:Lipoprotein n=1 Tax=Plastorhodobacter daqingensis TaxID=1387281 RepID=A0ABW2UKL1_9RHOB